MSELTVIKIGTSARPAGKCREFCCPGRNGPPTGRYWKRISGQPIFDAQGSFTGYRGVGKDVTAATVAEARIQYLAYHDNLTALPKA